MNTITHSLRYHVVGSLGYIGPHWVKSQLRQGCDIDTSDDLSACLHCPMRKAT